jgi:hypothetical protein
VERGVAEGALELRLASPANYDDAFAIGSARPNMGWRVSTPGGAARAPAKVKFDQRSLKPPRRGEF